MAKEHDELQAATEELTHSMTRFLRALDAVGDCRGGESPLTRLREQPRAVEHPSRRFGGSRKQLGQFRSTRELPGTTVTRPPRRPSGRPPR